jgi:hypothetical protein
MQLYVWIALPIIFSRTITVTAPSEHMKVVQTSAQVRITLYIQLVICRVQSVMRLPLGA